MKSIRSDSAWALTSATSPRSFSAASAFEELLARGNKLARPNYRVTKVLRMAAKNVIRFRKAKDPKGAAAEAMRQMRERSDAIVAAYRGVGTDAEAMRTMFRNAQMMTTFFADPFMPMVMNGVLALAQLKKLEEEMGCGGASQPTCRSAARTTS